MGPSVPDTSIGIRLLLAVLALGAARSTEPSDPGPIEPVVTERGCVLAPRGSGPACGCEALSAEVRWVLGLPLPLNSSDAEALDLLPGVGPALSRAIVVNRKAHGPFRSIEDLTRVRGIGPRTVERLRTDLYGVGPDPACAVRARGQELP